MRGGVLSSQKKRLARMLLALDIKNSGIVAGFQEDGTWLAKVRLGVDRSADELGILLAASAERAGIRVDAEDSSAWISSVVPALTSRAVDAIASTFGLRASVVGPGTKTGIKIRTDNPSELGSDIVCSAVAARARNSGATVVVDFGSALVLSALDSAGELLGVAMVPGLETAALALHASTAQIPQVRLDTPKRAIGKNTAQSIQSGILFGYAGLVSRLVAMMSEEMAQRVSVIGSGEEAGRAILNQAGFSTFVPDLVLEGIALIAERSHQILPLV